jgi:hypothetical protein
VQDFLRKVVLLVVAPSTATRLQRRVLGSVLLSMVVVLVFLGCFFLRAAVNAEVLLALWVTSLLLVSWAVFLAYVDVKSIKQEFRAEKKKILLSAFSAEHFREKEREKDDKCDGAPESAGQSGMAGVDGSNGD